MRKSHELPTAGIKQTCHPCHLAYKPFPRRHFSLITHDSCISLSAFVPTSLSCFFHLTHPTASHFTHKSPHLHVNFNCMSGLSRRLHLLFHTSLHLHLPSSTCCFTSISLHLHTCISLHSHLTLVASCFHYFTTARLLNISQP